MGQMTVLLLFFALQIIIFLYFRMMIRRELSRENRIDNVRREIEQLIIELDRTADRNVEIVEDRIRTLKKSITEGEKIIRLIESEWDKRNKPNPLYTDLEPLRRDMYQNQIQSESSLSQKDIIGITPRIESPMEEPLIPARDLPLDIEVVDSRERALELFRKGMDSSLIASATGLPRGEVELIISLQNKN